MCRAEKQKGFSAFEIFRYLLCLVFCDRSMYMQIVTGRYEERFSKNMFGYIFRQFTDQLPLDKTYRGYNLLAVDGSGVSLFTNEESDTYVENGTLEGYNSGH